MHDNVCSCGPYLFKLPPPLRIHLHVQLPICKTKWLTLSWVFVCHLLWIDLRHPYSKSLYSWTLSLANLVNNYKWHLLPLFWFDVICVNLQLILTEKCFIWEDCILPSQLWYLCSIWFLYFSWLWLSSLVACGLFCWFNWCYCWCRCCSSSWQNSKCPKMYYRMYFSVFSS